MRNVNVTLREGSIREHYQLKSIAFEYRICRFLTSICGLAIEFYSNDLYITRPNQADRQTLQLALTWFLSWAVARREQKIAPGEW